MSEPAKAAAVEISPVMTPPRKKAKPLSEGRMEQREFWQNQWAVHAPNGTTVEDLLDRDFWAHRASRMRPMDKICVMTDDMRLYVELICTVAGANWAQVHMLGRPLVISDVASQSSIADDYRIEHGGLHKLWTVVRRSDGAIIKGDGTLKTEDAARQWLRDFLTSQGLRVAA